MRGRAVPLSQLPPGSRGRIARVLGGRGKARRLMEMGLTPGSEVLVLRNEAGPVLVRVRGVTIAMGRGLARSVLVEVG